ncbi:MAG: capsular biosynthesis protein [Flavobacteriales bacterium]|nr:capsular biosynthesis protein [Flavobacteriales bacterium]
MGFLDKLFKKKEVFSKADLGILGTDMHSHLIPGIDDGVHTVKDAVAIISNLKDLGLKKIITTPHIMSDYYKNTADTINRGLDDVREGLVKANIDITVEAAAEYYLDFEFEDKIAKKELMTFGDNFVLVEVSFLNAPESLNRTIFNMQLAGYKPVLAHPERYPFWHHTFDRYRELKDKGVILQLNINSLMGYYSPQMKGIAEKMIDEELIGMLGTDCHGVRHMEALELSLTEGYLHKVLAQPLYNPTL